jgi:hypothetical protein
MTDMAAMMRRRRLTMSTAASPSILANAAASLATNLMLRRRQQTLARTPPPSAAPPAPPPLQRHSSSLEQSQGEQHMRTFDRAPPPPGALRSRPAMQRLQHKYTPRSQPATPAYRTAIASHSKQRETEPGDVRWIENDPFMIAHPEHCRVVQSVYSDRKTPKGRRKERTLVNGPRGYERFMKSKGFDPYPASLSALVSWQTHIVGPKRPGQVTHATAGRYLGAVINVHLESKWPWLPEAGEREYLATIRDSLGMQHGFSAPKVKQPITPEILHLWNDHIDTTTHNGRVCKAAACLATHCYLRGCEFLWDKSSPTQCLHRHKWHVGRGGATLKLHDTKPKKGIVLTAMVPFLPKDTTCPVEAIEDMIDRCPFDLPMDGPLFVCEDGKPLARARMMEWERALLAKNTGGHSCRGPRAGSRRWQFRPPLRRCNWCKPRRRARTDGERLRSLGSGKQIRHVHLLDGHPT